MIGNFGGEGGEFLVFVELEYHFINSIKRMRNMEEIISSIVIS
jgi:hypothetical protein